MPAIRKRGGRYQAQVRIKQNGVLVYAESATFDTKGAAQLWGLNLEKRIRSDGVIAVKSSMTVTRLLEKYAEARSAVKPLGKGFAHSLFSIAHSPLGQLSVASITSGAISDWALEKQKSGAAPATVLHHLATLSAAFRSAKALFDVHANVEAVESAIRSLRQLRVVAPSQKRSRRVTDDELTAICADLQMHEAGVPTREYVALAVLLPRRREELLTMLWSDLSEDGRTLRLRDTKNPRYQRDELVPVPPKALEVIRRLPRLDARILPYKPESVSAAFQRAVKRLGILDLRLHDLRHEGISRLFEQGLSIEEVALVSGHTSWTTLRRYTHLRPEAVTEKLHARSQGTQKATAQSESA